MIVNRLIPMNPKFNWPQIIELIFFNTYEGSNQKGARGYDPRGVDSKTF